MILTCYLYYDIVFHKVDTFKKTWLIGFIIKFILILGGFSNKPNLLKISKDIAMKTLAKSTIVIITLSIIALVLVVIAIALKSNILVELFGFTCIAIVAYAAIVAKRGNSKNDSARR